MSAQPQLPSDIEGLARQVDPLSRRGFFMSSAAAAAAGYTLAAGPVRAQAITTDASGLTAMVSDVPFLRDPAHGFGRGFDEVIWVRGQGYDPLVPAGDPRARKVRLGDEPGLRLPPPDDPDHELWKRRWEQFLRNRAVIRASHSWTCRRP